MALQRHTFAKGYITLQDNNSNKWMRVEESFRGDTIEIFVGDEGEECDCDCDCNSPTEFKIDLTREQLKELMFCLKQLHFIDKE